MARYTEAICRLCRREGEKLYLKGGQGSLAVIDLFNGLMEDPETGLDVSQLDYFKSKKEKIKNDGKKEHVDEFLVDADEREGKIKGEREKRQEQNDNDGSSGLYKQRDMKMQQEQKELGRGSEQGQEMREQHSRKWWKFWE